MNLFPAEAGNAAKAAAEAAQALLNQLPQDEFTAQMMKIAENQPGITTAKRPRRTKNAK